MVRKTSKATNNTGGGGSDYVTYSKTIDRAIILSAKRAEAGVVTPARPDVITPKDPAGRAVQVDPRLTVLDFSDRS